MIKTADDLEASADRDAEPPGGLSEPVRALWLCRAKRWDEAHSVAQEIDTALGSWIHALLHLIEGDISNANYWYRRAGRASVGPDQVEQEWKRIAEVAIERSSDSGNQSNPSNS
jgi:hypothetical protein